MPFPLFGHCGEVSNELKQRRFLSDAHQREVEIKHSWIIGQSSSL